MIRTLQLVTTPRPFFEGQVRALESHGVECTTLAVPEPTDGTRSPAAYLRCYADLLRRVSVEEFDLVHANYGLVGPLALAQPCRPVVLTLWGSEVMGEAGWLDRVSAWAARGSDAVIAPSESVSARLDCPHEVVPFGVDTEWFRPMPRDDARAALGWDVEDTVVLFPYDPERPVKNYARAERVVDRLPGEVELHALSGVPHEDVPLYMNASDAVLITSDRESGPMTVKEAAACNVPVVSTDVGFVPEVLDDVRHSAVCETDDALVEGLAAALSADERADGRDRIDALSTDRLGERLVEVYERVLDRPIANEGVPA